MESIKSKILSKFSNLKRIKELEKKLKEEEVARLAWGEEGDIAYKGEKYVTLYISKVNERRAMERGAEAGKKALENKIKEIEALQESNKVNCETITSLSDKIMELDVIIASSNKKIDATQKELDESLIREKDLRKDLIEIMKLNNALNSRTIETKTIASEPIEIKPVKKSKKKTNLNKL